MIDVRPANPADAEGITHVHIESWRTTYRGLMSDVILDNLSHERRLTFWTNILSDPNSDYVTLVAENKETSEIVGFASGSSETAHGYNMNLNALYLLKDFQGQGLGRRLVVEWARHAVQRGGSSMMIWVLATNLPGRRFYEALGGIYVATKSFRIGPDDLVEIAYGWKDLAAFLQRHDARMNAQ